MFSKFCCFALILFVFACLLSFVHSNSNTTLASNGTDCFNDTACDTTTTDSSSTTVDLNMTTPTPPEIDYEVLLGNYLDNIPNHPSLLPIYNSTFPNKKVLVNISFFVGQVLEVDAAGQKIVVSASFYTTWIEERLWWVIPDFNDLAIVPKYDMDKIWSPQLMIFNGVGDRQVIKRPKVAQLYQYAEENFVWISYFARVKYEVGCEITVKNFPNDEHECEIVMVPTDLDYYVELGDESTKVFAFYKPSAEWTLVGVSIRIENEVIPVGLETLTVSKWIATLKFKRISTYYMMTIILPNIFLSLLLLLVFLVPNNSGEKMDLGVNILLAFTFFLLMLDALMPKSAILPILSAFVTACIIMASLALWLCALILKFYHTPATNTMPAPIKLILVDILGTLVRSKPKSLSKVQDLRKDEPPLTIESVNDTEMVDIKQPTKSLTLRRRAVLREIIKMDKNKLAKLRRNAILKEKNRYYDENLVEHNIWKIAATTMDRVMLLVGFIVIIFLICAYLVPVLVT